MNERLYDAILYGLGTVSIGDREHLRYLKLSAPFEKGGTEEWQNACAYYRLALAIYLYPICTASIARKRGYSDIAVALFGATWPNAKRLAEQLKKLVEEGQIERSLLIDLRRCYPKREQGEKHEQEHERIKRSKRGG